ncbi:hypothetical protein BCR43DRAFT_481549 [Syncephalastrum racemosum]|uniref:Kelch repeat protein n=1 Tax=Syncephalastrum racemosum TaxID=13706 RepID=A0A1X2HS81_SYNRA|nr:hypothetical protein BCR43DRAFT_481549 [Syncephalastrum racemosum]
MIGCVALSDGIYCYGGGAKYAQEPDKTFDDLWMLLFGNEINVANISASWYHIDPDDSYPPQATAFMAAVAWPGEGFWIRDGTGPSLNGSELLQQYGQKYNNIITSWIIFGSSDYDLTTMTHKAGDAQMSMVPAVVDNGGQNCYLWGGIGYQLRDFYNGTSYNGSVYTDDKMRILADRVYGYGAKWMEDTPSSSADNVSTRFGHSAVYHKSTSERIYYFGGFQFQQAGGYAAADMKEIVVYDTDAQKFQIITANGDIPTGRYLHTTTLLPNNTILLFGGTDNITRGPLDDAFYAIDIANKSETDSTPTFTYRKLELPKSDYAATPIFGHSSTILVEDRYLFIIMGKNGSDDRSYQNGFHILDTSDYTWQTQYRPQWYYSYGRKKLSGGAIAGIVVGVVVGVGLIAGVCAFFFIRRRKQRYGGVNSKP